MILSGHGARRCTLRMFLFSATFSSVVGNLADLPSKGLACEAALKDARDKAHYDHQ
jgi:hypothetical protein